MKLIVLKEKFIDVPEINVEKGFKYCVGNTNNYKKSLMISIKSAKAKLPIMHNMLSTKETEGLRILAHTLVKIMDTIGAESIAKQALCLETSVLNNNQEETEFLLGQFVVTLEKFISRLEIAVRSIDDNAITDSNENVTSYINYDFTKTKELLKQDYSKRTSKII